MSGANTTQHGARISGTRRKDQVQHILRLTACQIPHDQDVALAPCSLGRPSRSHRHALPLAGYLPQVAEVITVDTAGVTAADLGRLRYTHRPRPMFPFEPDATFPEDSRT